MRRPFDASLMKDLLLITRDPIQWTQAAVFFGLLGAYFANLHRVTQIVLEPSWQIGIASLNLACTLLVFGSLAVRFIFPQMSLEGRSLWLVRIAPDGVRQLMQTKLVVYGVIAFVIIEGLLGLSIQQLDVPLTIRWWLAAMGAMVAMAIVGMTVGLGARWIDPSAQNAARVVSSSNGAFVLLLMLVYVGCMVAALVLAWTSWATHAYGVVTGVGAGVALLSLAAGWVPVRLGLARLERLDRDGV
jgi:ABC-2 type transport system permease protein